MQVSRHLHLGLKDTTNPEYLNSSREWHILLEELVCWDACTSLCHALVMMTFISLGKNVAFLSTRTGLLPSKPTPIRAHRTAWAEWKWSNGHSSVMELDVEKDDLGHNGWLGTVSPHSSRIGHANEHQVFSVLWHRFSWEPLTLAEVYLVHWRWPLS